MGKKKATMIFKGSLKTHWIRYITNIKMDVNPAHQTAMKESMQMLRLLNTISSKYIQPGFDYKMNIRGDLSYYSPSILHLKFVNGYERKYHLQDSLFGAILQEINYINHTVEYERSMNGQDDELDDEA
ncbi:UNKNOWN [Stylonychia lemnae]|uniref:Uncharacterized protein n=1 Tax=Stylonychia lemnae TaxID=5949 RepID=A0A078AYT6_STYLE|nr:UNKNOWN [Stylonychia lemnae]|eukprot:CDW87600.1 UNKNOWN [Stylonychia lemnae]